MSGHSKWSTIKRKKGAQDAKRSKLFSKVIKELTVAARAGGGDPDGNPRLRAAVQAAKGVNMPADNIKRAIQRGTGEIAGATYEEISYEGYGPGGVALMVYCLTDNRNRTVSEIRHMFSKHRSTLGEEGCVNWMFQRKGTIVVSEDQIDENKLMEHVLDFDVEDVTTDGGYHTVITDPSAVTDVSEHLSQNGVTVKESKVDFVPQNQVVLAGDEAKTLVNLLTALEDHEDVQEVVSNFDMDSDELERLMAES